MSVGTGEFILGATDMALPSAGVPFVFRRTYRNQLAYDGPLGHNWDHSFNERLIPARGAACAGAVEWLTGEASTLRFDRDLATPFSIRYRAPGGMSIHLVSTGVRAVASDLGLQFEPTGWRMSTPEGVAKTFDAAGFLVRVEDANGVGLTITWGAVSGASVPRIRTIVDGEGRQVELSYDEKGRIRQVRELRSGLVATYAYDTAGDLVVATSAEGRNESYGYDAAPAIDDVETYVPERFLEEACTLACAPTGSRCGAGGRCPAVSEAGAWCKARAQECGVACKQACEQGCSAGCQASCRADQANKCSDSCSPAAFRSHCGQLADRCDEECARTAGPICEWCQGCESACQDCFLNGNCSLGSCNRGTTCAENCRRRLSLGQNSGLCNEADPCGRISGGYHPECYEETPFSCTNSLARSCKQRCPAPDFCETCNIPSPALERCASACRREEGPCKNICAEKESSCIAAVPSCETFCRRACIENERAKAGGTKYGYWIDLAHNLTHIYRGDIQKNSQLTPYLVNAYGKNIADPAFDSVLEQRNVIMVRSGTTQALELVASLKYDLTTPLEGFEPVIICPSKPCTTPGLCDFDGGQPGTPIRGSGGDSGGLSIQGDQPKRRVEMTDPYGARWLFHTDQRGQILREANLETGAVRSFNYDSAGRIVGIEQPDGGRICSVYDRFGNLRERYTIAAPGGLVAQGDAAAQRGTILDRFEYRTYASGMTRLERRFDPRDPGRVFQRWEWDERGNLKATSNARGDRTWFDVLPDGRPWQEHRPDGTTVAYEYQNGTRSKTTVGVNWPTEEQVTTQLAIDAAGRPTRGVGPWGEITDWVWSGGRLDQRITTNEGRSVAERFTYDAAGDLETETNGLRKRTLTYDPVGHLRTVLETSEPTAPVPAASATTCFVFGPNGRRIGALMPDGDSVLDQHDGEGRLTHALITPQPAIFATLPCPKWTGQFTDNGIPGAVAFDTSGRPRTITDGREKNTINTYDAFGRLAFSVDPTGTERRFGYDALGNIAWTATYAPGKAPAEYEAPAFNFFVAPAGLLESSSFTYDEAGRLRTSTRWHFDESREFIGTGRLNTTYEYERGGLKVTERAPDGSATVREWDAAGRPRLVTLPTNGSARYEYLDRGRTVRVSVTAPNETGVLVEQTTLTSWGAPSSSVTSPFAPTQRQSLLSSLYDALLRFFGRPNVPRLPVTPPSRTWTYDNHKRLERETDVGGATVSYTYDAFGRVKTSTASHDDGQPAEVVTYDYTAGGRVDSRTSTIGGARAAITKFTYDPLGRVRRIDRPERAKEEIDYDGATSLVARHEDGRGVYVTSIRDAAGNVIESTATYRLLSSTPPEWIDDELSRRVAKIFEELEGRGPIDFAKPILLTERRDYRYDALHRVVYARNAASEPQGRDVVTELRYDSLGTRTREWNQLVGESAAVSHQVDPAGRRQVSTYAGHSVVRRFDPIGRLQEVDIDGSQAAHFDYRAGLGGPWVRTHRPSGLQTTYTYDALGRLSRLEDRSPSSPTLLSAWRWEIPSDGVPRIAAQSRLGRPERGSLFAVDGSGRLTDETLDSQSLPPVSTTTFPFLSRRAANSVVADAGGEAERIRFGLDARHNWTSITRAGGTTTPELNQLDAYKKWEGRAVTYDRRGAINTVASGGGRPGETYSWDLFGNLTAVAVGNRVRGFQYDAFDRIVGESDEEGVHRYSWDGDHRAVEKTSTGTIIVTVPGAGLDDHLALLIGNSQRYFVHQDRSGSVYMLTNVRGEAVEHYSYSAYGSRRIFEEDGVTPSQASSYGNRWGYQGHAHASDLDLVNMRARWYRPEMGRFLSPDPIGLAGGSNLYAFVMSAPLKYTDPFGLKPEQGLLSQQLTSRFWQAQFANAYNQAFGPGGSPWQRAVGFGNYLVSGPFAVAERIANGPAALIGNAFDQHRLRGQGRFAEADAAADLAGGQIRTALYDSAFLTGTATVLRTVSAASEFAAGQAATDATQVAGSIRNVNPLGGSTNCVNCVVATNATLAGRPASAVLSDPKPIGVLEQFFGGTFTRVSGQAAIEAQLLSAGAGAQGVVFGSRGPGQVGHVFNAVNQSGVVRFLDGQTGEAASFAGYRDFFFMMIPR